MTKTQNKKLRVAVIGVGNMGRHHARNYYEMPQANLVAVCDINTHRAEEIAKKFKCRFYDDFLTMYQHEKLDAVSIVVPTKAHYAVASKSIGKVKRVLLEKPITETTLQAKKIISQARKHHTYLSIGHIERFNPAVRKAKHLIDSGKIGSITSILSKRVGPSAPQIKNSNVLIDLAVHDVDIFSYILDMSPNYVIANGGKALHPNVYDYSEIFLKYKSVSGYIQVNWITPVIIRELHVTGTEGYLKVNYITQEIELYKSKYVKEFTDHGDFIVKFGHTNKKIIPVPYTEPLRSELTSFLLRSEKHLPPEVTPNDGFEALKTALQAEKSIYGKR